MKHHPLGDIDIELFLEEYWQKQPLLIRDAMPNVINPVSADELAGLACENHIESRLISHHDESWQLQHGPFNEDFFAQLPVRDWTLLVQAVDHYVPAAATLLELFDFIPRWRIDDLMVSYAPKGGGVGPHFDNYDVFLIQTQGQRLWQIGGHYDDHSELQDGLPVKIVKHFEARQSWLVNPGDIVYVPPGVGHNGISQSGDCMTCSVGFRAPSHEEILHEYTDYLAISLNESIRYEDANLAVQTNSGEISAESLDKIRTILSSYINDSEKLRDWFGCYITTPKYQSWNDLEQRQSDNTYSLTELKNHLASNKCLIKNEGSRFAYIVKSQQHDFYVDGSLIQTDASHNDLIESLCAQSKIYQSNFKQCDDNLSLLLTLLNDGALYLTE